MGLSSKQVSSTGLDWNKALLQSSQNLEIPSKITTNMNMRKQQQQQQQNQTQQQQQPMLEPLRCPRCDSTNTKFCYYNNYNKSQPRHFCRACKRHWTKGGTLRNVPVGGGRKNKRPTKKSTTTTSNSTTTTTTTNTVTTSNDGGGGKMEVQPHSLPLPTPPPPPPLYQSMIRPPPMEVKDFGGGGMFLSSSSSAMNLPQSQSLIFPFSTTSSSSFDANPSSVSASNIYSYGGEEFKTMEEPTINGTNTHLWEIPLPATTTSAAMEMSSNYWGWEDLDPLVSTDLNVPWDDSDIKP